MSKEKLSKEELKNYRIRLLVYGACITLFVIGAIYVSITNPNITWH